MRTITIEARHFGLILRAFNMIEGRRSLALSYKLGRILAPITGLQTEFLERIKPFVGAGGHLREDITDEEKAEVETLIVEEIEIEIPEITIQEFTNHVGLTIQDDTVLPYLVDVGVIVDQQDQAQVPGPAIVE